MSLDKIRKIHDILVLYVRNKFTGKVIFEVNFAKGGITRIVKIENKKII